MHEKSSGRRLYQIPLPFNGTVSSVFSEKSNTEMFLTLEGHLVPLIEYRIDFHQLPLEQQPELKVNTRTHFFLELINKMTKMRVDQKE